MLLLSELRGVARFRAIPTIIELHHTTLKFSPTSPESSVVRYVTLSRAHVLGAGRDAVIALMHLDFRYCLRVRIVSFHHTSTRLGPPEFHPPFLLTPPPLPFV